KASRAERTIHLIFASAGIAGAAVPSLCRGRPWKYRALDGNEWHARLISEPEHRDRTNLSRIRRAFSDRADRRRGRDRDRAPLSRLVLPLAFLEAISGNARRLFRRSRRGSPL